MKCVILVAKTAAIFNLDKQQKNRLENPTCSIFVLTLILATFRKKFVDFVFIVFYSMNQVNAVRSYLPFFGLVMTLKRKESYVKQISRLFF